MLGIISPPDWNRVNLKFMFFKKATKFDDIFTIDLRYVVSVKSTVKISSIFVAFLENMNFIYQNLGGDGPLVPPITDGPAVSHPRIIAVQTSATPSRDGGRLQNSKGTPNLYIYFCSLFHILAKLGVPSVPHSSAGIDHHHTYQIATILPKRLTWLCYCKLQIDDAQKLTGLNSW